MANTTIALAERAQNGPNVDVLRQMRSWPALAQLVCGTNTQTLAGDIKFKGAGVP